MADLIINGQEFTAKPTYPDVIACEKCGEPMEFVSIELGYSCTNDQCELHMVKA